MNKILLVSLAVTLLVASEGFSYARFTYYLNKTEGDNYEVIVVPSVSGASSAYVKGPTMAEYEEAPYLSEYRSHTWHSGKKTFTELQAFIVGTWYVHIFIGNYAESIYSFTIADTLQESDFLPVPSITQPAQNADNVIAQHCTVTWNPNGADTSAEKLWVRAGWNSATLDVSTTSWYTDWLTMGDKYCKVWYAVSPSGLVGPLTHVSWLTLPWDPELAYLVSSNRHKFVVKYSLDLNEDYRIDFKDLVIFFEHWLDWGPTS